MQNLTTLTPTMRWLLVWLLFCCTSPITIAANSLEVIPLKHRSAAEVIPVLRPFLDPQGALTGTGYQLIVRTTPENLVQLRDILKRIDTAPRRLMITVKQSSDGSDADTESQLSGRAQLGSGTSINSPDRSRDGANIEYRDHNTRLRARTLNTQSRNADADTQQVQALEGHEALIQIGQSVPVLERSISNYGGGTVEDQLAYKDVLRGFYVLPRINGDQVTLDISPQHDTLSQRQGGAIDVQRLHTTVSGRLGEWLEIGGGGREENRQQNDYTRNARTARREQRRVLVKVEEIRE
ncbi:MAG: secretin N-terminal domain-containing protein [Gammaproteobacteria bacterium]